MNRQIDYDYNYNWIVPVSSDVSRPIAHWGPVSNNTKIQLPTLCGKLITPGFAILATGSEKECATCTKLKDDTAGA